MFLLLLPLINACFDFVSYGVTLALLQCGLKKGPGYAIFLGLADLGFAIVLYAALAATLTAAISLANIAGSPVFALGPLFQDIRAGNHPMWIYFMLFSTALPTTVHLVIVGFSLVNWVPQGLRDRLIWRINDWENSNHSKTIAALGVSTLWLTTTIAPFVALGFLTWGLFVVAPQIGETYLQIIELVARWFGEIKDIGPGYLPRTFEI